MLKTIREHTAKASKTYRDDGWEWMKESIDNRSWSYTMKSIKPTFSELRMLVAHKNRVKPCLILPGDIYISQFNECDGDAYTYRMNRSLYDFACKYQLFHEF